MFVVVKWLVRGRILDQLTTELLAMSMVFIRLALVLRLMCLSLSLAVSIIMIKDDGLGVDSYALPFFTFFFIF